MVTGTYWGQSVERAHRGAARPRAEAHAHLADEEPPKPDDDARDPATPATPTAV
jgi:hypothetical protein